MPKRFHYLPEVAERLGRTKRAVEWLIYTKQLPAGKLAGRVVVDADVLERFIEDAFAEQSA